MELENVDSEGFVLEISSNSKIAVAVYRNEKEYIYLPEATESQGTYYQDTSDSLIKTENGYRLELGFEPDSYSVIG